MISKLVTIAAVAFLAACAGDQAALVQAPTPGSESIFQRADQDKDGGLNYPEFRHYADLKARQQGAEAMNQRALQQQNGNRELHTQFLFLDRNNDGRISHGEITGS
jgi:Ca2+-binding EF-hand superfamily protein